MRIKGIIWCLKTEDGEGIVDSIETLKEKIRVKLKDGEIIEFDLKEEQNGLLIYNLKQIPN